MGRRGRKPSKQNDNGTKQKHDQSSDESDLESAMHEMPRMCDIESIKEALLPTIKEALIPILKESLREALSDEFKGMVRDEMRDMISDLKTELNNRIENIEQSVNHVDTRINSIYSKTIPSLVHHINNVAVALSHRILDTDVHRRKWSLNIHGLQGSAGEPEHVTRAKCAELAFGAETEDPNGVKTFQKYLGIEGSSEKDFSACHRLNQDKDAGIIVRFVDLKRRNEWLENAKKLRGTAMEGVSISPDLPPAIRPFKKELLNQRRQLPPHVKSKATIKYLKSCPYVELRIKDSNEPPLRPSQLTQRTAMNNILGGHPLVINDPHMPNT